jgi:hypothetical protein
MPKGEIVGKCLTGSMLVIDGKYKQWRWQDKEDKIPWGFGRESSGETTLRKTRSARLKDPQRRRRKTEIHSRWSEIPSAVRSDQSCTRFTIRKCQGEIPTERRPSDLIIDKKSALKRRTDLRR